MSVDRKLEGNGTGQDEHVAGFDFHARTEVDEMIERGSAFMSTGSTGAKEADSSDEKAEATSEAKADETTKTESKDA